MTGKDIYTAMQNIDRDLVEEAWEIKPTVKKYGFVWNERIKDNFATVAIVCLVALTIILVPKIVKNVTDNDLNPAGIGATVDDETSAHTPMDTEQGTFAALEVNYDNVPENGKVIDGILYEYSTWLDCYRISDWSLPGDSEVTIKDSAGYWISPKLAAAISGNAIITESNADKMTYLVEISASMSATNYSQADKALQFYSQLTKLGDYRLLLGEAGKYKSNYADFYVAHEQFVYARMTCDEMKELSDKFAAKNSGNSLCYNLLSAFETDRANIYTDNGVPKYSAEDLSAEWKYVYSKERDMYIVSKNNMSEGRLYSDSCAVPTLNKRITYSNKLEEAVAKNKVVNVDNADRMTYLVEINVYNISVNGINNEYEEKISMLSEGMKGEKLKAEYERLKSACNYDIRLGEKYWQTSSKTLTIYAMLTCDQMKSLPLKDGYGYSFNIAGEITFGPAGVIEESLYGKGYLVINADGEFN